MSSMTMPQRAPMSSTTTKTTPSSSPYGSISNAPSSFIAQKRHSVVRIVQRRDEDTFGGGGVFGELERTLDNACSSFGSVDIERLRRYRPPSAPPLTTPTDGTGDTYTPLETHFSATGAKNANYAPIPLPRSSSSNKSATVSKSNMKANRDTFASLQAMAAAMPSTPPPPQQQPPAANNSKKSSLLDDILSSIPASFKLNGSFIDRTTTTANKAKAASTSIGGDQHPMASSSKQGSIRLQPNGFINSRIQNESSSSPSRSSHLQQQFASLSCASSSPGSRYVKNQRGTLRLGYRRDNLLRLNESLASGEAFVRANSIRSSSSSFKQTSSSVVNAPSNATSTPPAVKSTKTLVKTSPSSSPTKVVSPLAEPPPPSPPPQQQQQQQHQQQPAKKNSFFRAISRLMENGMMGNKPQQQQQQQQQAPSSPPSSPASAKMSKNEPVGAAHTSSLQTTTTAKEKEKQAAAAADVTDRRRAKSASKEQSARAKQRSSSCKPPPPPPPPPPTTQSVNITAAHAAAQAATLSRAEQLRYAANLVTNNAAGGVVTEQGLLTKPRSTSTIKATKSSSIDSSVEAAVKPGGHNLTLPTRNLNVLGELRSFLDKLKTSSSSSSSSSPPLAASPLEKSSENKSSKTTGTKAAKTTKKKKPPPPPPPPPPQPPSSSTTTTSIKTATMPAASLPTRKESIGSSVFYLANSATSPTAIVRTPTTSATSTSTAAATAASKEAATRPSSLSSNIYENIWSAVAPSQPPPADNRQASFARTAAAVAVAAPVATQLVGVVHSERRSPIIKLIKAGETAHPAASSSIFDDTNSSSNSNSNSKLRRMASLRAATTPTPTPTQTPTPASTPNKAATAVNDTASEIRSDQIEPSVNTISNYRNVHKPVKILHSLVDVHQPLPLEVAVPPTTAIAQVAHSNASTTETPLVNNNNNNDPIYQQVQPQPQPTAPTSSDEANNINNTSSISMNKSKLAVVAFIPSDLCIIYLLMFLTPVVEESNRKKSIEKSEQVASSASSPPSTAKLSHSVRWKDVIEISNVVMDDDDDDDDHEDLSPSTFLI